MDTDRKWVVVRIDGKIAAISTDYRLLAEISSRLAEESKKASKGQKRIFGEIAATSVSTTDILELRQTLKWEDLMLFGTEFQKKVWRMLWKLTHSEDGDDGDVAEHAADIPRLICYSDFAEICQNRAGVRAVAHAIGLNPVSVVIPCHLIIPKEAIDKIKEIQKKAETTIFKGDDLCIDSILSDPAIDLGEYAQGRELKRELIRHDLGGRQE
jgi:O6-methylguanine-DNA--protein-cysteine methyltransferase